MHELIRASTFARLKRLALRSVRRMLQDRGMPGRKRGTTWYVEAAAAAEWLAQHSPRTTAREKGPKVRPKSPRKSPRDRTDPDAPPAEQGDAIDQHITRLGHILAAFIGTLDDGGLTPRRLPADASTDHGRSCGQLLPPDGAC